MPRIRQCRYHDCKRPAYVPKHYCSVHAKYEAEYEKRRQQVFNKKNPKKTKYYNQVIRKRNPIKAKQNRFYHTKEWRTMREVILKRDYYLCQYCKAMGLQNEGNVVDHVLPVEKFPEHMRDGKNLVTCCRDCHYWKTRWEEQYYGTGLHHKATNNPALSDVKLIAKLTANLKKQTRENANKSDERNFIF